MRRFGTISFPSLAVTFIAFVLAYLILAAHAHLLYYGNQPLPYYIAQDSVAYVKIASGHLADVESPFSKRILYPFLVGKAAGLLHLPLATTFMAAGLISYGVLAYCLAAILAHTTGRPFLALIPLVTAFGFESLSLAYLPDLFHAAFTALFFLLLLKEQRLAAMLTLFFLCLARDNTFFLCVVLAILAWLRGDGRLAGGTLLVFVLGVVVSSAMARFGKPNVHHLWEPLYLALKVPYNLLYNVFGIVVWSDVRPTTGHPFAVWHLPALFHHVTRDSQVGLALDMMQPFITAVVLLTIFGTGPLLFLMLRRGWKGIPLPLPIQLALVYGVLSYFLGVSLGNWVFRLVGYGWPAFWIALPYLIVHAHYRPPPWKTGVLVACFLATSWLWSFLWESPERFTLLPVLIFVMYAVTLFCLWTNGRDFEVGDRQG